MLTANLALTERLTVNICGDYSMYMYLQCRMETNRTARPSLVNEIAHNVKFPTSARVRITADQLAYLRTAMAADDEFFQYLEKLDMSRLKVDVFSSTQITFCIMKSLQEAEVAPITRRLKLGSGKPCTWYFDSRMQDSRGSGVRFFP